jgi:hypothetical protein
MRRLWLLAHAGPTACAFRSRCGAVYVHGPELGRIERRHSDHAIGQLDVAVFLEGLQDCKRQRVLAAAPLPGIGEISKRETDAVRRDADVNKRREGIVMQQGTS